tara:strand:+ start:136 stop:897 length:762 start_codon:yes stop_codon:yes gene_type:complete
MFSFNIGDGPLNETPVGGMTVGVQEKYIANYVTGQGVASQTDLPKLVSAAKGTVNVQSNAVSVGISAGVGGPTYDLIKFEGIVQTSADNLAGVTKQDSNTLKTENEFFIFSTGGNYTSIIGDGGVTGTNIREIAGGVRGITKLLPQGDANQSNHVFDTTQTNEEDDLVVTRSEISATTGTEFIYVAFPSRVGLDISHLFKDGSSAVVPSGFKTADKIIMDITNAYGYIEPYDVFRSNQADGLPNADFKIRKPD